MTEENKIVEAQCSDCNIELYSGDEYQTNSLGEVLCLDCSKHYNTCSECGAFHQNGGDYCDDCEPAAWCSNCHFSIPYDGDVTYDYNGSTYCPDCTYHYLIQCENCDEYYLEDKVACPSCGYGEEESDPSIPLFYITDIVKVTGEHSDGYVGIPNYSTDTFGAIGAVVEVGSATTNSVTITYRGAQSGILFTHWLLPDDLTLVTPSKPALWYKQLSELDSDTCALCGANISIATCSKIPAPHCVNCCHQEKMPDLPPHWFKSPKPGLFGADASKFQPDSSEQWQELWKVSRNFNLDQAAADFYVLVDLECDFPEQQRVKDYLVPLTNECCFQLGNYLNMAIGGELRHLGHVLKERGIKTCPIESPYAYALLAYYPTGSRERSMEWGSWYKFQEEYGTIPALTLAHQLFSKDIWQGSIGGKKWAVITQTLLMFLRGETTPRIFVDTAFGLKHNGSIAYNKLPWVIRDLEEILNLNINNKISSIVRFTSLPVNRLYQELKGIEEEERKCMILTGQITEAELTARHNQRHTPPQNYAHTIETPSP